MRKRARILLLAGWLVGLAAVGFAGTYLATMATPRATLENGQFIRVGMTEEQISKLLGADGHFSADEPVFLRGLRYQAWELNSLRGITLAVFI
jgi:hypothetical protein